MHLLIVILLLSGCGKKPTPQASMNGDPKDVPRAEIRIGGDEDEARHLSFKITTVYEKQKTSSEPPFHAKGGDWTFFDCQAASDPKVAFTVGVMAKGGAGGAPVAWGKAVLVVKDREAGGRFVKLFSKSFSGMVPKAVEKPYMPKPLFISTAILGQNLAREAKGGFSGEGGGWTATKWFPEQDGRSGEVFFNYNLTKRQGEFSEKDADYADDLLAVFASALRDGPRPERTPENDPNLTRIGPKIGQPRKLPARRPSHQTFSPKGQFAVYQDDSTILALSLDKPDSKPFVIGRFDHSPWDMRVLNEDLTLLVQEPIPQSSIGTSSADPMRIWWVDHKNKEKKLLRGPEKDIDLEEAAISPDYRYVALKQYRNNPAGKTRTRVLLILDRLSDKPKLFQLQDKDLTVVGWKNTDTGVQVVAVTNRWRFNENEPSELYLADPNSGKLERQEKVDARFEIDNRLSPDGKYRVRPGKEELVVTDTADGKQRRFVLHEDDRRFASDSDECIEWASPRYLKFNGSRLALIDVTTMKMCFPATADGAKIGSHACKFSSDFRWVLYQGEGKDEGLFLAPVEMPKEE
jgi:hypothetical protein